MRKEFYALLKKKYKEDSRVAILLGDIGVFSFNELFKENSGRIINCGIMEQSMVSIASGMSKGGYIPFVHSIAPFVTERCAEQIKLALAYERSNTFVVSVGNSYDYASLGCTHHCPADLSILGSIPEIKTFAPGNARDVERIVQQNIELQVPKYIRLSEVQNDFSDKFDNYEDGCLLTQGIEWFVVVIGNSIKKAAALTDSGYTCYYSYSVSHFDIPKFKKAFQESGCRKICVLEPSYQTDLLAKIAISTDNIEKIRSICIQKEFIDKYGTRSDIDSYLGLDDASIFQKIKNL